MSNKPPPGDQVRVSMSISLSPQLAFQVFTEEIDQWWRRGLAYRVLGKERGIIHIEPKRGGRLFESFETSTGTHVVQTGQVTVWEPPSRLVLEWRTTNFTPDESTEVEVEFQEQTNGTLVILTHRGWSQIRSDHPVRHGQENKVFLRQRGLWWANLLRAMQEHVSRRKQKGANQ